ncbi:MAG: DNA replication/repair protein RecF [Legionellales bacterium RIFCSPHIGHO2_12_FULL_42_9]|nr:MAG: DNA replication/repair protein RecF [Legionellales bacterium RIFCSPHIGHO2_12_FULL_42_9]
MTLKVLYIEHLRNLAKIRTALHPHLNIITGVNGSGKTSFLEAIFLLGCGRSFRTREITTLITHGNPDLTVYAKTIDDQRIAIRKSLNAPTIMRLNDSPCESASELARFLPTQIFYQDIFQIIDAGPAIRRSLLDWGLFHVKQNYFEIWKNYRRALKQRNSLLRHRTGAGVLRPWNKILSELAHEMDIMRQEYLVDLNQQFQKVLISLSDIGCNLQYYKGWDRRGENKSLEMVLTESLAVDLQYQYTRYGSHQAELLLSSHDRKLKHYLSRGQQKIVLFALKIAQAQLVNRFCVFLIDDLFAELDDRHIARLMDYISTSKGQFFITCHESSLITPSLALNEHIQITLPYDNCFT